MYTQSKHAPLYSITNVTHTQLHSPRIPTNSADIYTESDNDNLGPVSDDYGLCLTFLLSQGVHSLRLNDNC